MIKGLKDAQITDGLPRVLAEQPWVRALSLAAKKSAICRVPHTMVLWAWQSITPGRRYFPAPSITVSNTVSPGACPTDRIILSSITTLFTSKSVPFQTFAD